jgi:hypothetical protein
MGEKKKNVEWALCDGQSINKVHMKGYPSKILFIIHVRGGKYQSNKK